MPNSISAQTHHPHTVKHGRSSIMLQGCFLAAGCERLEGKMDAAKCGEILEDNFLPTAINQRLTKHLSSSKARTWRILLKLHTNGLKTRWMLRSAPIKDQTSSRWRICRRTWKGLFITDPHTTWRSLNSLARKKWSKIIQAWSRPFCSYPLLWFQTKYGVGLLSLRWKLNS